MEDRMTNLEVKVAFVEHQLSQLDGVLRGAIDTLDELTLALRALREERNIASVRGSLEDEVPPHHVTRSTD